VDKCDVILERDPSGRTLERCLCNWHLCNRVMASSRCYWQHSAAVTLLLLSLHICITWPLHGLFDKWSKNFDEKWHRTGRPSPPREIAFPLERSVPRANTWFLVPTSVQIPNIIFIGLSVLAQLAAMCNRHTDASLTGIYATAWWRHRVAIGNIRLLLLSCCCSLCIGNESVPKINDTINYFFYLQSAFL